MVRVVDAARGASTSYQNRRLVARSTPSLSESVLSATPETLSANIARETGFGPRSIGSLRIDATAAPKTCSPSYFLDYLSPRRPEGCVRGRQLLHEIKLRGYTSSFSYLERVLVTRQRRQSRNIASGCRADGADVDDRDSPSRRRSRDRVIYLANCRGIIVYQAARIVDARTGSKGRRSEKCVVGFHNHASARHAIPRHSLVNRVLPARPLRTKP